MYITHFYCLAVEAGFNSDVVKCLPLNRGPVSIPTFGSLDFSAPRDIWGQCGVGLRHGFRSCKGACLENSAWFRADSRTNLFKAGEYIKSRLLQRLVVFAFRCCGPSSIPTSGGWDFSATCDIWWPVCGSTCVSGIKMECLIITA